MGDSGWAMNMLVLWSVGMPEVEVMGEMSDAVDGSSDERTAGVAVSASCFCVLCQKVRKLHGENNAAESTCLTLHLYNVRCTDTTRV
jgi:hypothetical protein